MFLSLVKISYFFSGEYCEIDMSAQYENGMCPQDVCQAPSHCVPLIEGGFRCDGCPNTEDYNSFCELTARSFPVKGSYLTYPTVKSRYRFKIQLRYAHWLLFLNSVLNKCSWKYETVHYSVLLFSN